MVAGHALVGLVLPVAVSLGGGSGGPAGGVPRWRWWAMAGHALLGHALALPSLAGLRAVSLGVDSLVLPTFMLS
jgi:hypothetical protein